MMLRKYQPSDCSEMAELFYHTVHGINARDYSKEQLDAWATGQVDLDKWNQSFLEHESVVAVEDGNITTHASITARPFFERRGYKAVKEQQVERQGISLTNFVMVKMSTL